MFAGTYCKSLVVLSNKMIVVCSVSPPTLQDFESCSWRQQQAAAAGDEQGSRRPGQQDLGDWHRSSRQWQLQHHQHRQVNGPAVEHAEQLWLRDCPGAAAAAGQLRVGQQLAGGADHKRFHQDQMLQQRIKQGVFGLGIALPAVVAHNMTSRRCCGICCEVSASLAKAVHAADSSCC